MSKSPSDKVPPDNLRPDEPTDRVEEANEKPRGEHGGAARANKRGDDDGENYGGGGKHGGTKPLKSADQKKSSESDG